MTITRDTIDNADESYGFDVHNHLIFDDDSIEFFKVFTPEHVGLMEAIVEAFEYQGLNAIGVWEAHTNLVNYRRDHGLI